MPEVSLCIPTYNGSRYLPQAIASARAQTFEDVEILVVDDGSSDGSYQLACDLLAGDPRGRVERNAQNLGLVGNWNRCVELARGSHVKFLFQDDWLEPECTAKLLAASRETDGFAFCDRGFHIEEDADPTLKKFFGEDIQDFQSLAGTSGRVSPEEFLRLIIRAEFHKNIVGEPTCAMFRREHWSRFGGFSPYLAQICDWEFWMRIGANHGCFHVPEKLCTFRVHGSSQSAANFEQGIASAAGDALVIVSQVESDPAYAPLRRRLRTKTLEGRIRSIFELKLAGIPEDRYHPAFRKYLADNPEMAKGFRSRQSRPGLLRPRSVFWRGLDRLMIVSGRR